MGLLDKVKNLFTDEVEVEEDLPIKKEFEKEEKDNQLPTFMREKIEEEKSNEVMEHTSDLAKPVLNSDVFNEEVKVSEAHENVHQENQSFRFPIFEENDFVETTRQSKQNALYQEQVKKKEEEKKKKPIEVYGIKKEKKDVPKFKSTPIISPVYGILDKNYTKEEVKVNDYTENNVDSLEVKEKVKKTPMDFETVRRKAFGGDNEEIREAICENCELYKEARRKISDYDDVSMEDRENKEITLGEASENYYDYGVSYEASHVSVDDEPIKINNHIEENSEAEQIEIKEPVATRANVLSTLRKSMGDSDVRDESFYKEEKKKSIEDLELTDDLFNLIDSMYEERNDD